MATNSELIPKRCDVVVIGGGPAGSSVAALLAREGLHVVLFEKVKHPRPQVGESIIPHFWKFADLTGVSEKLQQDGFISKAGGIIVWGGRIHHVAFSSFGYTQRSGLHVERDRFDHILLRHASECGAEVFEEVAVSMVDFSGSADAQVVYRDRRGADRGAMKGRIRCTYVVDASGHSSLLASQFNARKLVGSDGRYLGLWGYYENSRYMGIDGRSHHPSELRRVKPVTFVLSYKDGWAWHIILRDKTSVGLVINTNRVAKGLGKKGQERYFRSVCAGIPYMRELLEPATFIEGSMYFRPDYSYYSETISGDNFFCIGDAAGFVDPIFSQGVQAAFYNASVCAWAIAASLKHPHRKETYRKIYEKQIAQYYGFMSSLAFGHFGNEGVNLDLVQSLMQFMPQNELELALAAAATTDRSINFEQMARDAGMGSGAEDAGVAFRATQLEDLDV